MKKIVVTIIGLIVCLSPVNVKAITNESPNNIQNGINEYQQSLNLNDEQEGTTIISSENAFVISLAEKEGISFIEAQQLNDKNTDMYLKQNSSIARSPQFIVDYVTKKQNFRINQDFSIEMAVEVKYIRNNETGRCEIMSVGNPYVGTYGPASSSRFEHSDYSVQFDSNKARISVTGQAFYNVSVSASVGLSFAGMSCDGTIGGTVYYHSNIDTYVMNIYASGI